MTVEVRLFATLRKFLPAGGGRAAAQVELAEGATVADALAGLAIPAEKVALVLVDGKYEADRARRLGDRAVLSVFPHVAGG